MANPASFTITSVAANAATTPPAAQTVDTNGTVPIFAGSKTDRMMIEVANTDDAALTVAIKAGDNPPALRAGIGVLSVTVPVSGTRLIGPLESARFAQDNGDVNVSFTAATGSPAASVRVYRLAKQ